MTKQEEADILLDIQYKQKESLSCYNLEQAIKLCINSIYGAFANDYFHFRSTEIAETVTLQGQDAIKHTEVAVEKYFKEFWHKDKKLHEAMGLTDEVQPLKELYGNIQIRILVISYSKKLWNLVIGKVKLKNLFC